MWQGRNKREKKDVLDFKQNDLVTEVSKRSRYTKKAIREILNCMDDVLLDIISQADEHTDVVVKISKRIKAGGTYSKGTNKYSPLTETMYQTKPRIKPMIRFLKDCTHKVNEMEYEEETEEDLLDASKE